MADNSNALDYPGQINVLRAELVTHSGVVIDITAMIDDITLYEDIFSNTMSGYALIEDALDLISTAPLIGQEIFLLELQTPTVKEKISKRFYIYKLSSRSIKSRKQNYILNFCSTELISSLNSKVTKAFSGVISDTVIDIFQNERYFASPGLLRVDKTKNNLNFIAPYWTPLQTINWLAEKSINQRGVSNYVFYESNQSFEFTSIDSLLKSTSIREYTYADVNGKSTSNEYDDQFNAVRSIDTDIVFDNMKNTSAGMYGSTLYTFDLTTKTIAKTTYDYFSEFDKSSHLEKFPLRTPSLARKQVSSIHHLTKNNYRFGTNIPLKYSEFFLQRNSLMEQLTAIKFNINVFGRTDIKVGDVITFTTNELRQLLKDEIETSKSGYFSGRYLISAIRHQIIAGNHTMNMEIISDSFIKKLN